ncbi:MAG: hypothetical protein HKUEN01_22240 [Candidatus Kuenenia stuttgartiensis]|nr:MAG: hypothetical protein HKUEN01_22240 [Candidatus Kuenenia stuttgartiensis]
MVKEKSFYVRGAGSGPATERCQRLNTSEAESAINDNKELLKLLTRIINSTKQGMDT